MFRELVLFSTVTATADDLFFGKNLSKLSASNYNYPEFYFISQINGI